MLCVLVPMLQFCVAKQISLVISTILFLPRSSNVKFSDFTQNKFLKLFRTDIGNDVITHFIAMRT